LEARGNLRRHRPRQCVITVSLDTSGFFQLLSLKAQDAHFVLRGKLPTKDVVLIEMDDKTLNKFPEPTLFWQPYYAEAIQGAADAGRKVLILDVAFDIPVTKWEPNNDPGLAAAYAATSQKCRWSSDGWLLKRTRKTPPLQCRSKCWLRRSARPQ